MACLPDSARNCSMSTLLEDDNGLREGPPGRHAGVILALYTGEQYERLGGKMSKRLAALLAAILSTACIGVAILVIGGAALFNPNGTASAQSPAQASAAASATTNNSAADQAQIQQLQSLVAQYQAREQQYQAREQQYQQQLAAQSSQIQQAQQQMQEIRNLLLALEQRGLITITQDGQIIINQ